MSTEKTFDSPISGKPATLIGWVESSDMNKAKEIDSILASFKKSRLPLPETQLAKQANVEGGNDVSDIKNNDNAPEVTPAPAVEVEAPKAEIKEADVKGNLWDKSLEVTEEAPVAEATDAEEATEDTSADSVEKAAEAVESTVDEPDFAKMLGDLKGFFSDTLSKATEANAAQVSEIKTSVESFSKNVDARILELAEKHSALSAAVSEIQNTIDGVQKQVEAVENETAIKKSSDLGGSEVVTKSKSKWNGSFLGSVNEIFSN